jgi:hypothetical protein
LEDNVTTFVLTLFVISSGLWVAMLFNLRLLSIAPAFSRVQRVGTEPKFTAT